MAYARGGSASTLFQTKMTELGGGEELSHGAWIAPYVAALAREPTLDEVYVPEPGIYFVRRAQHHRRETLATPLTRRQWIDQAQVFAFESGEELTATCPHASGRTASGLRWDVVIPPLSQYHGVLVLRRSRFETLELNDFLWHDHTRAALETAICRNASLVVFGPSGSGKSSLLCAILKAYRHEQRMVILEQFSELPRLSPMWTHLRVRSLAETPRVLGFLLRAAPAGVVLGEVAAHDAALFTQLDRLGLPQVLATAHARDDEALWHRLACSGTGPPLLGLAMCRTPPPAGVAEARWLGSCDDL